MSQQVELACRAADAGSFDIAVAVCEQVGRERVEYSACRALIASVYRQVGRHDRAAPFDADGAAARPADALGSAMCRLGLAADRVGVADAVGAAAALRQAEAVLGGVPADHWATRWFDPWLTHAWISAEIALLRDRPGDAIAVLEPFAVVRPRAVPNTRWPFERAKTWLFLGVAQSCHREPGPARDSLAKAAAIAADARLAPLLLPAVEQLAVLDPGAAARWAAAVQAARAHLLAHRPPGV